MRKVVSLLRNHLSTDMVVVNIQGSEGPLVAIYCEKNNIEIIIVG